MTPAMIAALTARRKSVTGFFEIDLPSGTRRLLLGSGEAAYGGNTFKGYDSTIGSISSGDELKEDSSGVAPNTSITIQVASSATKADIAGEDVQLAPVRISLAALGLDTGKHVIAIPDPELMFDGFIDQAVSDLDKQKDEITYTVLSAFDYFFEDSEGQRLNDQFHESMWAGELGLSNVTGVARKIYWGALGPNSASGVASVGVGSGGGLSSGGISPRLVGGGAVNFQ
jgi:hypothetical protein